MEKTIQLFLLPYAGGSAFSFMKTARFLDKKIETIPIEYAGRGSRKDEPYITSYKVFIEDVCGNIKSKRNKELPFSIFGYSMGTALLFDIISDEMISEDPIHCFFCAGGSLVATDPSRMYSHLPINEFREKILNLGGIDKRILKKEDVLNEYLELIKADHDILSQYKYNGKQISVASTIIYNKDDPTCVYMEDWKKICCGYLNYCSIGSGHFFINDHYKEIADVINKCLCGG